MSLAAEMRERWPPDSSGNDIFHREEATSPALLHRGTRPDSRLCVFITACHFVFVVLLCVVFHMLQLKQRCLFVLQQQLQENPAPSAPLQDRRQAGAVHARGRGEPPARPTSLSLSLLSSVLCIHYNSQGLTLLPLASNTLHFGDLPLSLYARSGT